MLYFSARMVDMATRFLMTRLFRFLLLILPLLAAVESRATHLRAGEIVVRHLNCTSSTYEICITVYTNTGSEIRFGDGVLNFGDGSQPHITPTIQNTVRPDLGPNVGTVTYCITHIFPGAGQYTISYLEPNRNAGILNMFNSVETKFYLETVINIDPFLGCDDSPRLLVPPIDKGCTGAAWYHNPGAYDPDGDSLSFEFTIPKKDKGQLVNNYRDPNVREFYDQVGINYSTANETQNGSPTFTINPRTGTIIWDAPGKAGEYNIAFLIIQWRKFQGAWIKLGYVTRDMQIIIDDCDNTRPELQVPADICVEAGQTVDANIFGFDPDGDDVKLEAYSYLFSINPSPATFTPNPATFQPSSPSLQAKGRFIWNTKCEHIRDQSYQVDFKITDKPKQGASLVQFKTWNIRVVGPAPKWQTAQLDLATRSANLVWDKYLCQSAATMQVWRRVDKFDFTPPECVTGMPDFLGYTKIDEVPITQSIYKDTNGGKGLASGAQYCYRLVAVFPQPGGGESYVSQDICLPPILADVPVITNVTVDKTNKVSGQITVKWRSPFDASKAQFPPPYTFDVFRAEGLSGNLKLVKVTSTRILDSTFVDTNINTEDSGFNYRIDCYDRNGVKVGTSVSASSVRLEPKPLFREIQLTWTAEVPWSNQTQDYPRHLIYRGTGGSTESQLVLIDSVDVNQNQFVYIDSGQYQHTPLKETDTYCYRVMTRGAYGNPKIKEPLLNFSQMICAQPNDEEAPCAPKITSKGINCESFGQNNSCSPSTFSNIITWTRPKDDCGSDIKSYTIYEYASSDTTERTLLAENIKDTFYIHTNIPSYARCYKVAAVDRSGNVSSLSDVFCFDNCPHYELPNVFTPNGDNCNEVFSAYSDRATSDENGNGPCGPIDLTDQKMRCARFVEKVHFTVVNRWGKEVFTYESGGERNIYIDWDGRDNNGNELASGVYYYIAEVTFDVVDPSQREQTIRGWVQLVR
jgi:hypothetical protein